MQSGIYRWIFEIPLADVQTADRDTSLDDGCLLCGKPVKVSRYAVHLLASGSLVSTDLEFDNDQGFFPIGGECRKRLPNNFVFELK